MQRRVRHLVALAAAGLLTVTAPAAVGAAVVTDGVVTVTFRALAFDGGPATPLADAKVELAAYVSDFEAPIQEFTAITDASGVATFTGVPREDGDGPAVRLVAAASLDRVTTDANGCVITESWAGQADGVLSEPSVTITIEVPGTSSMECGPPVTLSGRVLGSSGEPLDLIDVAQVSVIVLPAGGAQPFPLEIGADGSFSTTLPPRGTADAPATIRVEIRGRRIVPHADPICWDQYTAEVTWETQAALEAGQQLPTLDLVAPEVFQATACGNRATTKPPAAPANQNPTITLPPTDGPGGTTASSPGALIGLGAALLALAGALVLARWRASTSGSRRD